MNLCALPRPGIRLGTLTLILLSSGLGVSQLAAQDKTWTGLGTTNFWSDSNAQLNALHRVTLTGDATFRGTGPWTVSGANPGRWDIRGTPATAFLSMGGQPWNFTKTGANEVRLAGVTVDQLVITGYENG
jgi:hypothetical protein